MWSIGTPGVGESAIRSRHLVLRAALAQAARWEWIATTRPERRGSANPIGRPATARASAISSGHDVRTVAGRLDHANPAMTMRVYAHVVDGADEVLASALGQALDGAPPS